MNVQRVDLAYAIALSWLLLVSILCLVPMPDDGVSLRYADKLAHMLWFAVGGLSIGLLPLQRWQHFFGLLLLVGVGGLIEGLQMHSGLRHAEWADFSADALGAVAGLLLTRHALRWMSGNRS